MTILLTVLLMAALGGCVYFFLLTRTCADYNIQLKEAVEEYKIKQSVFEDKIEETTKDNLRLLTDNAKLEERNKTLQEQIQNITNITQQLEQHTKSVIQEQFIASQDQSVQTLKYALDPIQDQLNTLRQHVSETADRETQARSSLLTSIEELQKYQSDFSERARDLVSALTGQNRAQGDWGEMVLQTLLETSGLIEGIHFTVQGQTKNEEGTSYRPDVVVKFPDNKNVIIDSKVSLVSFMRLMNSSSAAEQKAAEKDLMMSIKLHIDGLANKNYEDLFPGGIDFVMLFVPVEGAYMQIMQLDPSIWQYAYKKRIVLMSPTSLIPALRIVHHIWQRDGQQKMADKIVKEASNFYDKIAGFCDSFVGVGDALEKASNAYHKAKTQLSTGKGNLIQRAESFKQLHLQPKKKMDESLLLMNSYDEAA
jgi:DNA recombination protein RmuC